MRAAAALAEHHVRTGDRVGMLVVAADGTRVPLGSGSRHLHRLQGTLARVRTEARGVAPERLDLGAGAGSVVYVLSPMFFTPLVTATASLQRSGASVVVIDTIGDAMAGADGDRLALPALAARMQKVERDDRLAAPGRARHAGRAVAWPGHARHRPAAARAPRPGAEGACVMAPAPDCSRRGVPGPWSLLRALVVALPCVALALAIPEVPHWFVLAAVPLSAAAWARAPDHAVGIVPLVAGRRLVGRPRGRRLAGARRRRPAPRGARVRGPAVLRPGDPRGRPPAGQALGCGARCSRWCRCRSRGWPCGGSIPRWRPSWLWLATGAVTAVAAAGDGPADALRARSMTMTTEEERELYAELVLQCAESVPRGRVTTYGAIADVVGHRLGRGGPRLVGNVLATHGAAVAWWRVVRADGSLPPSHDEEARQAYLEEGTPLRPSGSVDLGRAFHQPTLRA